MRVDNSSKTEASGAASGIIGDGGGVHVGGATDDTFNVTLGAFPDSLHVDGGAGFDTLNLDTYSDGAVSVSQNRDATYTITQNKQEIATFENIESLFVNGTETIIP
jgi:hypothetical protein